MTLVTITAQVVSPDAGRELCREFCTRYEMQNSPGWVRGFCAIHATDPCGVVIVMEWGSRVARDAWTASEMRYARLQNIASLLATDLQTDIYEEA